MSWLRFLAPFMGKLPPVSSLDHSTTPVFTPPTPTKAQRLYEVAKRSLGEHLTMDSTVPEAEGCAEAVSYLLFATGYVLPRKGLPTVVGLVNWLLANGFEEALSPAPGYIIASHKWGTNDPSFSHVGICGKEWIMSNTSYDGRHDLLAGRWQANYSYQGWHNYFDVHSAKSRYFRPVV